MSHYSRLSNGSNDIYLDTIITSIHIAAYGGRQHTGSSVQSLAQSTYQRPGEALRWRLWAELLRTVYGREARWAEGVAELLQLMIPRGVELSLQSLVNGGKVPGPLPPLWKSHQMQLSPGRDPGFG